MFLGLADDSREDVPSALLIDDDPAIRSSLSTLLRSAGYQVATAQSGPAGIALAEEFRPRIILLDVSMPDMDGYAVCRQLKSQLSTADIPVVFVTALEATADTLTAVFDAGADDFLAKPVNKVHLLARLRVILRQGALRDAYRRLATQDALTTLTNRRQIFLSITESLMRSRKDRSGTVLILADIDHFKRVNDRYGHDFGDEVLLTFSRILKRCMSAQCLAGRIGGEEFVLLLLNASREEGLLLAERVRETFAAISFDPEKTPKHFTASFGVAWNDGVPADFDADQLLKQADIALYAAKDAGRNRSVGFWTLDPNSLPAMDPRRKNHRDRRRQRSERSCIRPAPSNARGQRDAAGPAKSQKH
jgi:diguanylate cyclase (GGDEF)-like protein